MRYRSPSVFSLGRWTSHLPAGLACPAVLLASSLLNVSSTGLSPTVAVLSRTFDYIAQTFPCGLLRFRSPLLAEYSLFLGLLRCFSSPGSLPMRYVFTHGCTGMPLCGFPHSDISDYNGCTHLIGAFRSVPRPSSALDAKAFTVRSCSFSAMCYGEIVALALLLRFFAILLLMCCRVRTPLRLSKLPA